MIVFLQQIGRVIEANNTNTPVIIDAVNNFSSASQGMCCTLPIVNKYFVVPLFAPLIFKTHCPKFIFVFYHGINLYNWYLNHKNKFTNEQLEIMNMLIPKTRMKPINIKSLITIAKSETFG